MIQNSEGYRAALYDAGDNMATIGFGYTFNRNNNVELWDLEPQYHPSRIRNEES